MARTSQLRYTNANTILISLTKPYKTVTAKSLAQGIRQRMADTGVDISLFS